MRAIEISAPDVVNLVERPRPTAGAGEALLRVRRVGFCGTDLSTFRGANPLVRYPRVPGHEIGATIEQLGPGIEGDWRVGQNVLVIPYTSCGACSSCRAARPNCCARNETLGVQRDGAMAEFIAVPVAKLLTVPGLSLCELALVEPLTIGFHAVARGRVTSDDVVAVIGCGAIGLGVIAGAAGRGARVIAVDVDDAKLALAVHCGATDVVNSSQLDLHATLQALTGSHGPSVIIEAVGSPATFRLAVEEVAFAGRVVYIGYAKAPVEYDSKQFVLKELDILGSRNALPEDFARVAAMLERKQFPVEQVVTQEVDFAGVAAAFQQWSDAPATVTKIQLVVGDD
ncbi:zinc-binding alcohol dehydrogenase family protein [Lacipirellula sp.]|uniref:zinc-binding alcohol dehydrogenase family protein n=1 Tax=Lacipirellula sp. TaxID=2691419 RepID=UPI003D11CE2C